MTENKPFDPRAHMKAHVDVQGQVEQVYGMNHRPSGHKAATMDLIAHKLTQMLPHSHLLNYRPTETAGLRQAGTRPSVSEPETLDVLSENYDPYYALDCALKQKGKVKLPVITKPYKNLHQYAERSNLLPDTPPQSQLPSTVHSRSNSVHL